MLSNRTHFVKTGLLLTTTLMTTQLLGTKSLQAQGTPAPKKEVSVTAPLAITAKTDQPTYKADSAIKLTLIAKNTTQQEVPVRISSGQRYDFELFRGKSAKGEKVWQWSKGRMFTMMLSSISLKPGKPLEYSETYRPGGDGMPALPPGFYTVVATFKGVTKTTPPVSMPSAAATFQVN
ncbi:MAG: Intracellular proteinase inhibitor [Chthonomonadales bacterium]|nr:Intracellular proteinase inhibitor [Chthonomonadales bacterium]